MHGGVALDVCWGISCFSLSSYINVSKEGNKLYMVEENACYIAKRAGCNTSLNYCSQIFFSHPYSALQELDFCKHFQDYFCQLPSSQVG